MERETHIIMALFDQTRKAKTACDRVVENPYVGNPLWPAEEPSCKDCRALWDAKEEKYKKEARDEKANQDAIIAFILVFVVCGGGMILLALRGAWCLIFHAR